MQIRSRKTENALTLLLAGCLGMLATFAQSAPPAQPATAPAPAPVAPAAQPAPAAAAPVRNGGATDGLGDATGTGLDYIFHQKAANDTLAKQYFQTSEAAKNRALAHDASGDRITDPQMRERFIKFLGMQEISADEVKAYANDTTKVFNLLDDKKTFDAWKQLSKVASYEEIDAGLSWELANRVRTIWDAGNTTQSMAAQNDDLQRKMDSSVYDSDILGKEAQQDDIERMKELKGVGATNSGRQQNNNNSGNSGSNTSSSGGSGSNATSSITTPTVDSLTTPPQNIGNFIGKMQLNEEYMNALEDKARMKWNEIKADKLASQTQQNFEDYIKSLADQKSYRLVLLAADFYRCLFDQGEYPVAMAKEVDTALGVNRDVANSINVFMDKVSTNEIAAATDRLEEAFMTDEFNPQLLAVPREMKHKVEKFTLDLSKMENMIEAQDYGNLDPLLAEMHDLAPDFDATKANSLVQGVKLESQMHMGKAKMAAQMGDMTTAMAEFQSAAEAWPGNPDLTDKANQFFASQDAQTQALAEFDRLVKDDNYRAIYDKQLMFAPAMANDTTRQGQLKDELMKYKDAETALEKANVMQLNGDVDGAWETIELAAKNLPNDLKLNSMRADLAGKAADFVSAINKAKDAEGKSDLGYSLTWYAIAQRQYPASEMANEAIERISKQILDKSSI